MTNLSFYQDRVLNALEQNNKPMTATQVAEETNMTTQRAAAVLRSLCVDGRVHKKCDGNKIKYSTKDFKTMESFVEGYKWFDDYPFIVAHPHTSTNTVIADKGFRSYVLAVIYAEYLSIIRKEEICIIDNR